jgi:hypothetical protein
MLNQTRADSGIPPDSAKSHPALIGSSSFLKKKKQKTFAKLDRAGFSA